MKLINLWKVFAVKVLTIAISLFVKKKSISQIALTPDQSEDSDASEMQTETTSVSMFSSATEFSDLTSISSLNSCTDTKDSSEYSDNPSSSLSHEIAGESEQPLVNLSEQNQFSDSQWETIPPSKYLRPDKLLLQPSSSVSSSILDSTGSVPEIPQDSQPIAHAESTLFPEPQRGLSPKDGTVLKYTGSQQPPTELMQEVQPSGAGSTIKTPSSLLPK